MHCRPSMSSALHPSGCWPSDDAYGRWKCGRFEENGKWKNGGIPKQFHIDCYGRRQTVSPFTSCPSLYSFPGSIPRCLQCWERKLGVDISSHSLLLPAVKCWVCSIEIFRIQMVLDNPEPFPKPLEMHDFPRTQEPDGVCNFLVFHQPQDIVIGTAGLLLCSQILCQIRNWVAFGLEFAGVEGNSPCSLGPQRQGVVNIIFVKPRCFDFLWGQVFG